MSTLMAPADMVRLESVLLGPLEIRADTVITFPMGLPGFTSMRKFALVDTPRDELVWLQSVDDPELAFLLADPFTVVPGFEVDIPAPDLAAMCASGGSETLLVLVVVQLEGGVPIAANLRSPMIIDRERRQGRQVVLPDSDYSMHHPIAID